MALAERRTNKRVPAKFKINYIHGGDYLISYSKDLSVDGMFIYTKDPPSVGETTELTFSIGKIDRISVDAKVIWVNTSELETEAGMGVQFINPPLFLKETILEIVNKIAVLLDGGTD
jgi:uncharacterized protein (TIGR02266 family)